MHWTAWDSVHKASPRPVLNLNLSLARLFFSTWLSRRQLLCRKRRMRIGACISSALLNRRKNRPIAPSYPIRQVDKTSPWLLVEMPPLASGDERRRVNRRLARHMRHPPAPSHVRTPLSRTNRARIRRCVSASPLTQRHVRFPSFLLLSPLRASRSSCPRRKGSRLAEEHVPVAALRAVKFLLTTAAVL